MTFREVFSKDKMIKAANIVKSSNTAGVDGKHPSKARYIVMQEYDNIIEELCKGSYRPDTVRLVQIRKDSGKKRNIAVSTVLDRCLLKCLSDALYDIIAPSLSEHTYAYKKGRGCIKAIQKLLEFANEGYSFFLKLDVEKCFDNLDHDLILYKLRQVGLPKEFINLVNRYLKVSYDCNSENTNSIIGCPQGSAISPILFELVMDSFDLELIKRDLKFIRYADDIIIAYKSDKSVANGLKSLSTFLKKKCKLNFNKKTRILNIHSGIDALGFLLVKDKYDHLHLLAKEKSILKIKHKIGSICNKMPPDIITRINQEVSGWISYYHLAEISDAVKEIDEFINQKLTTLESRGYVIEKSKLKLCHDCYNKYRV